MKASPLLCVPSKSRESRRWRVIQALVRSTTHLSSKHMKAFGNDLVPVDLCSFGYPHSTKAGPGMIHDVEAHSQVVLHPVGEWRTGIAAVGPDHLETRQLSDQRLEQDLAPCSISDISRQDFDAQQQPLRVHEQMPFSAQDFFPPVVAALIATHGTGFDRLTIQNGRAWFGITSKP